MKWAFIDYENVGTLAKIDLSLYERAFVFMGAKQPRLDFGETKYEYPINIQIIQIAISQNNNLDFHLAYYLGKTNVEAPAGVVFEVISNDNGFSPLLSHLKKNGRQCKQLKMGTASTEKVKLVQSLSSKAKEKRPKKIVSLKNHIASHLRIKGDEVKVQGYVNQLMADKYIHLEGDAVIYR